MLHLPVVGPYAHVATTAKKAALVCFSTGDILMLAVDPTSG